MSALDQFLRAPTIKPFCVMCDECEQRNGEHAPWCYAPLPDLERRRDPEHRPKQVQLYTRDDVIAAVRQAIAECTLIGFGTISKPRADVLVARMLGEVPR